MADICFRRMKYCLQQLNTVLVAADDFSLQLKIFVPKETNYLHHLHLHNKMSKKPHYIEHLVTQLFW